jgi:WD40 repeat protein
LESTPLSAAWSPDGKTLACSRFGNPKVLLWDAVRGVPKGFLDSAIVATAMAWRPDSRSLVLADLKSIEEWDVDVPARVRVCKTFFPSFCPFPPDYPLWAAFWSWTGVRQGGFSPDAAYYASAGLDGSIHFVDTVTGHTKRVMLHISANDWLSVLPEGHWIGSPAVEKHLVYVALTDQGEQIMLTPEEFAKRYDWKNIPSKTE